jgi:hypothetical protein
MAHVNSDRVKETTTTTGTGAITLDGAVTGFEAFSAALAANDTCYYCIAGGAEWEVGYGTYNTTLTRTTVYASSNADAAVNFSAGTKEVFITLPARRVFDPNWVMLTADYTLNNVATEQKAFNTTTNGALTLPAGVYYFDCFLYITTMSATSGNAAFDPIGAGTATGDRFGYDAVGIDNANAVGTAAAPTGSASVTQQTVASVVTAGTAAAMRVRLGGMFRLSAGGTIIPSVTLVTAAAAVMKAGSYFRISRIGESSQTSFGPWS